MKIVGRYLNSTAPRTVSILNPCKVEAEDVVQPLYRSGSGLGILGTHFEVLVNRRRHLRSIGSREVRRRDPSGRRKGQRRWACWEARLSCYAVSF